jgi:hypothetical protein
MRDLNRANPVTSLRPVYMAGALLIGSWSPVLGEKGDDPAVASEPATENKKLLCMWRNKGVTGFCDVGPEAQVGSACSCKAVIEHKARKFTGKVIVSR